MMTREEAIDVIQRLSHTEAKWPGTEDTLEALDMAIDALRPVSWEQVEKVWKGCKHCDDEWGTCNPITRWFRMHPRGGIQFCSMCGRPLTDEAVEIRLKELEALYESIHND